MAQCAWTDKETGVRCLDAHHGKSKYCLPHKRMVRAYIAGKIKEKATKKAGQVPLYDAVQETAAATNTYAKNLRSTPAQASQPKTVLAVITNGESKMDALNERAGEGDFAAIFELAMQAAHEAAKSVTPVPMMVQQHASVLDDNSPVTKQWLVSEGVCGMAWVHFERANTSFTRWMAKNKKSNKGYKGGCSVHIHLDSQSYERAVAAARAFCLVVSGYLPDERCYTVDRLD